MDYSQFFSMIPEVSLMAILLIVFFADMATAGSKDRKWFNPLVCVLMLVQVGISFMQKDGVELFGGMYVTSAAANVMKTVLSAGRYVLSKWHNINTKTIRDNIHDLLMMKYTPQSLNKIYNYIVKDCGGMTSLRSLQTSLSLSNTFEAYEGNLWGLRDKRYPVRFHKSQKMNGKQNNKDR